MKLEKVVIGGLYRHFKGGHYVVQSVDRAAEAPDVFRVSYRCIATGETWSRALSEWSEPKDGAVRFELIAKKLSHLDEFRYRKAVKIKHLEEPTSEATIRQLQDYIEEQHEGLAALQSTDDMGPHLNAEIASLQTLFWRRAQAAGNLLTAKTAS